MVGEELLCQREPANSKDRLADVVMTQVVKNFHSGYDGGGGQ